jgi:hypothetical protein
MPLSAVVASADAPIVIMKSNAATRCLSLDLAELKARGYWAICVGRNRHPNAEIEPPSNGPRHMVGATSRLGIARIAGEDCSAPRADRTGCRISINSTPKNPSDHARRIRQKVDKCRHRVEVK